MSEIKYENGQPGYSGNTVVKCFKDNGNGLLFRIVNDEEHKWAFYNDTTNYQMLVKVAFGKDSKIEAIGNTTMQKDEESGEFKCELEIAPTTTEMFIEGEPNGFKISFEANPIAKA
ncbi:calpain-like cysteine peptidase [Leishmania donovani]|uniref:Calpain-like_cysteine_peptidase_-_putative n=3 Tax=Leishmania donovani species complex TaxID=38574 RepID=A0A6L0WUS2_LEIIN|nr:putative calpain-like cysteine peptidase [Leishmania infantum JPCM5]XP_001464271.1 putative calpain-like cysteine peptidase [Leishmania infantum JPCM5]XP_003859459.1 calpain-like cysteine peptidase, putative [Leishmania donovani]XP_003859460.1 calpain-like cysteine peptidase, putative [Leishmania donovani]CAC9469271.1 calpain-like_cysteine_peptidase_-_putative [Leishmania infantum]AYU77338.1 small myristoylated protein-3, putative [Leishmania donovani]AYU77339.1 small myristoylated protein|eukprot:XP_001464270.1 putative calpain-like cysteine peptidase [Leishmania infantum JPCM5]